MNKPTATPVVAWKRGRFDIRMFLNGKQTLKPVNGQIRGHFGIHRTHKAGKPRYVMTHIKSGLAMGSAGSLQQAKEFLATVLARFDIEFIDRRAETVVTGKRLAKNGDAAATRKIQELIRKTPGINAYGE